MDKSGLDSLLLKAKEEFIKTFLLVWVKKELDTSKAPKAKKYIARILTVKNQINNK